MSRQLSGLVVIFFSLSSQNAYAYFDPGTGSLLIQLIIASVAGCLLYIRAIVGKVKSGFQKGKKHLQVGKFFYDKYALFAGASGLFAAVFYSSHNSETLTFSILASNVVLLAGFSFLLIKSLAFALRKFPQRLRLLNCLIIFLFFYYLRFPLGETWAISKFLIFSGSILAISLACGIVGGVIYVLARKTVSVRHQHLALILLLSAAVPTYDAVQAIIINNREQPAITRMHKQVLAGIDSKFQRTPNVYFFILDSYTSIAGLRFLGIDNLPHTQNFFAALHNKDFTLYPSFFTNFQPTIYAVPTYLNMDVQHNASLMYDVPIKQLRAVAAGNNPVSKIFSDNDYQRYLLLSSNHLTGELCQPPRCLLGTRARQFNRYVELFDKVVAQGIMKSLYLQPAPTAMPKLLTSKQPLYETWGVENKTRFTIDHLAQVLDGNNPQHSYFIFLHMYLPLHTEASSTKYGHCNEAEETRLYAERLSDTHRIMLAEIEKIIAKDNDALIILAGDHGPYILDRCAGQPVVKTIAEVTELQGAFLAIRWGEDYHGKYDQEIKTSANLFRYIFSYLLGHEQLLDNKPADDVFYKHNAKTLKSIADGVIIIGKNKQ